MPCDESWIYCYDPETKIQSSQWKHTGSPRPQKARQSKSTDRTMYQSTTPSLSQTIWPRWALRQFLSLPIVQTLFPVTFAYSLCSEDVVMRQLKRWKRLWRRPLTRSHKKTSMGPSTWCWSCKISALQPEEIFPKGSRVSWVYYQ